MDCYVCGGNDLECNECKGSNVIRINRCPRAIADGSRWVYDLLPYFFDYFNGLQHGLNVWPDGRGRIFQPHKLVQAFDLLTAEYLAATKPKEGKKEDATK